MIALNLDDDNRILSSCKVLPNGKYGSMPIVDILPEGNLPDYLFVDGGYVYDPLPATEQPEQQPTQEERIAALEEELLATKILLGVN